MQVGAGEMITVKREIRNRPGGNQMHSSYLLSALLPLAFAVKSYNVKPVNQSMKTRSK